MNKGIAKGISFGDLHSYHDLDLILSKVEIPPATLKTSYIDVPGADGSIDQTEALGKVNYNDRTGCKFTFTMNPMTSDLSDEAFEDKKTEISNLLNGMVCRIILDKDPDYYYFGRVSVDNYLQNKKIKQIVVSARVKPYKYKVEETVVNITLSADEETVTLTNGRKSVVPVITCTNDNTSVKFGNFETTLSAGTHKVLDICLEWGENSLTVSGSGSITFTYQEADL